jgi:uncharacterized delta-60 repeat protein
MKPLFHPSCLLFFILFIAEAAGQTLVPDYYARVNGNPYHALAADAEGNILVYQHFDALNGAYVGNLAKLDGDGQLLSGFNRVFTDGNILQVEVQNDNKILIRGDFTAINGNPTPNLVRLNADGTVDTGFTCALAGIDQFKLQSDGKIVVVVLGKFSRLNTNGTSDETFSMPQYFTPSGPIEIGPDDDIYVPGFSKVYKLKPDGGYDQDFYVGTGVDNSWITSIEAQSDGKILVGGMFTAYNGFASKSLVRLLADGQVDATFNVGVGPTGQIFKIVQRANDNILIGGQFYEYNGKPANLVELKPDGSLQRIIAIVNYSITSIAETPDGKITIGGEFTTVNGVERSYVAKFNTDYTINNGFNPVLSYNNPNGRHLEVRKNGSALIGGTFDFEGLYDGSAIIRKKLIQLDPAGLYDKTFSADLPTNPYVYSLLLQDDNKLLLGGPPDANNASMVRLNPEGTRDDSFEIGTGPTNVSFANGIPYRMKLKNDTIYVAGHFDKFNGVATQSMVALKLDGTIARTFSGLPLDTHLHDFDFQSDGKIIAIGTFEIDGTPKRISRFNRDGTLDHSFALEDVQGNLNFIRIDSLDRVYIGGDLYSINGALVNSLLRLLPNGNFDMSFDTGTGFEGRDDIRCLEILPDGLLAVGGYFSAYNDEEANGFVFLENNGTRVPTSLAAFGKKSAALNLKYSNGALYLDGRFVKDDYSDVYGIVKILLDPVIIPDDPTNLTIQLTEPGTFKLEWEDNSDNEVAFILERSSEGESYFTAYDTVAENVTSAFDSDIIPHKEYLYRVKAINSAGGSEFSNVVSATWTPEPAAPLNLRVSLYAPGTFQLEWDDQSSNELSFILERSTADQLHFVSYDTLPADVESTLDETIAARKEYFYRIKAINNEGESEFSNVVSASWIPGPHPPGNLNVDLYDPGTFKLQWDDNSSDEVAFIIERSAEDPSHFAPYDAVISNIAFDSNIDAGKKYFYRVKAINDEGASDYSNVASHTWLPAPQGELALTIAEHSRTEFILTWNGSASHHLGFLIERSESPGFDYRVIDTLATNMNAYVDAVQPDKIYFYRVAAYNEIGMIFSNEISSVISGLENAGARALSIYPVPAKNILFAEIPPQQDGGSWIFLTPTGQNIYVHGESENGIIQFDMKDVAPGIYLAQYVIHNKAMQSTRIVISR